MTDEPDGPTDVAAERRRSAIEAGRRKGGVAGAALAGAMISVAEIVEGPRRDDVPVTVEASGEPDDVDRDGVSLEVAGVSVVAPALARRELPNHSATIRRRRGRRQGGGAHGGANGSG